MFITVVLTYAKVVTHSERGEREKGGHVLLKPASGGRGLCGRVGPPRTAAGLRPYKGLRSSVSRKGRPAAPGRAARASF